MEAVYTRGNHFWQGNHRFLIKGISYIPRQPENEREATLIDALSDDRIDDLERDIEIFKELGLNTIQVVGLDPTVNHDTAMSLLAEAGIYVLVRVCEKMKSPIMTDRYQNPDFDTSPYYTLGLMRRALRVVDQLSDHLNLLGIMVNGCNIRSNESSKIAEASRAAVRDIKAFLQLRQGRKPPVGIHMHDVQMQRLTALQYFTAGSERERVDFFAHNCYSWTAISNFRISGWQSMCTAMGNYPVPMFLAEYGSNTGKRFWDEVGCLYSLDMTTVFSGGCLYTYYENGNNYGIVKVEEGGVVRRKKEFGRLKRHFNMVNLKSTEEQYSDNTTKDYESWTGAFPPVQLHWHATANLPGLPGDAIVDELLREIQNE